MFINPNEFLSAASDSEMIQKAVDEAEKSGKTVIIPKYNERTQKNIWEISKTIYLYDESTIILQNSHLRLTDGSICRMFSNSNVLFDKSEIQKNITIKGIGGALLDGGEHNGLFEVNGIARTVSKYPEHNAAENVTLYFENVENLLIEGLTIKDWRYWAICMYGVFNSRVANIHFSSSSNVPNQDGVDILKGCHDIIVENITGCVGDNIVAILTTADGVYKNFGKKKSDGDVHDITIRNIMGYGVGGCSLIRLLNHDGYKIYNVRIDNVIETSPWSENDAPVAQNPDLVWVSDDEGNITCKKHIIPGEAGYRCESAIIIGESYWYKETKAQMGDTYGISISNVMTHARFGVWVNNTLSDSDFSNIRMFGNGFMAVYFGEGNVKNVRFSNISYDDNCLPLKADEHINIEWNNTKSEGLYCVYFNGTNVENISFDKIQCSGGMNAVFGGNGKGNISIRDIKHGKIEKLSDLSEIELVQ